MVPSSLTAESPHYAFYRREVDRAIRDCDMWDDLVRSIVYATIITETCDGRPKGWLNYTNPREPQFARFEPNDGDPPSKSWSTQRSGGLFQQQPQFWGPNVMDPYLSARAFLLGVGAPFYAPGLRSFDYRSMQPWRAAQRVQGSEFADASNYRRNYPLAIELINERPATNWWSGWFPRKASQ